MPIARNASAAGPIASPACSTGLQTAAQRIGGRLRPLGLRSPPPAARTTEGTSDAAEALGDIEDRQGDAFDGCQPQVGGGGCQRQSDDGAGRLDVPHRRTFAGEIGERQQATGSRSGGSGWSVSRKRRPAQSIRLPLVEVQPPTRTPSPTWGVARRPAPVTAFSGIGQPPCRAPPSSRAGCRRRHRP